MADTFYIDGIDASTIGIHLQEPVRLSEPEPEVSSIPVPGRNGNKLFYTGAYKPRTASVRAFLLRDSVTDGLCDVNKFLLQTSGYHKLSFTPDVGHFVLARIRNGAEIAARASLLAPFTIRWECRPQRFTADPGSIDIFESNGTTTITNNHVGIASPLIMLRSGGTGRIIVSSCKSYRVIDVKRSVPQLSIDCDTMQAYSPTGPQNDAIFCEDFPEFCTGENSIALDGIERVQIIPRWWDL